MASYPEDPALCLMCLESPGIRKFGNCQHAYCKKCLLSHFEQQMDDEPGDVFGCPACRHKLGDMSEKDSGHGLTFDEDLIVSCSSRPTDDVSTNTAEDKKDNGVSVEGARAKGQEQRTALKGANCRLCFFKGVVVAAKNVCNECRGLPLCSGCTSDHRQGKATECHVVTSIDLFLRGEDVFCDIHGDVREIYCKVCSTSACSSCVSLEHFDHEIRRLNDILLAVMRTTDSAREVEQGRLQTLRADVDNLKKMTVTGDEMEVALIQSIEDHGEKCIEQILKLKEDFKKTVHDKFMVIRTMKEKLEKMPEVVKKSEEILSRAVNLLGPQVEFTTSYAAKLAGLKVEIDELTAGHPSYEKAKMVYTKAYKNLRQKPPKFFPRMVNFNIGGFKDEPRCDAGGECVCEVCKRKFRFPHIQRIDECDERGYCTCGTCGEQKLPKGKECQIGGFCVCRTCGKKSCASKTCERQCRNCYCTKCGWKM